MRFFSDNAAAACPAVMAALADANRLDTAYDGDQWSARLDGAFSDLFGKDVRALWVTTGTAANCLGLAALVAKDFEELGHGLSFQGTGPRWTSMVNQR